MNKTNTIAKIITSILILLLLVGSLGFIFRFTNGFQEDFKSFYLTHEGKNIVATNSEMCFLSGEEYRFDVNYVFEFLDEGEEVSTDYSVKIVPNVDEETDFTFTVNGEDVKYSSITDLTSGFNLDKQEEYFTFSIPENASLASILQVFYGEAVEAPNDEDFENLYLYTLVVSSYNERVTYYIDFMIEPYANGIRLNEYWVVFA